VYVPGSCRAGRGSDPNQTGWRLQLRWLSCGKLAGRGISSNTYELQPSLSSTVANHSGRFFMKCSVQTGENQVLKLSGAISN